MGTRASGRGSGVGGVGPSGGTNLVGFRAIIVHHYMLRDEVVVG